MHLKVFDSNHLYNSIVRLDMVMYSSQQHYVVELTLALTIWYYACPCA